MPATGNIPTIRRALFNVGLDVIFVSPLSPQIEKQKGTINKNYTGMFPNIEHWFIHSPRQPNGDTFAILFPRRPDQSTPKVTRLLDGRGCIVEHQNGRDFIFASPIPVTYNDNGIEFTGRYAVLRDRVRDSSMTLLEGTLLKFKGKELRERGTDGMN